MNLFDLAPELVQQIVTQCVLSRNLQFARAMRLRRVSRQFKNYVDDAIFRLRLLGQFVDAPCWIDHLPSPFRHIRQGWLAYVHVCLTYQALRERSTTSHLGRIRCAAQALCEEDGDTGIDAITACIKSLVCLAACKNAQALLLQQPTTVPSDSPTLDFKTDICVAAVYLGRIAYVRRLIAEGVQFVPTDERPGMDSRVFGTAYNAAAYQGDLEMIKLIFSCNVAYDDGDTLPYGWSILINAARYGHRAAFDYALDTGPYTLLDAERRPYIDTRNLLSAMNATPIPENYERAASIMGTVGRKSRRPRDDRPGWLVSSAGSGKVEMVRYFLSKGVPPNNEQDSNSRLNPLWRAICHCDDDTIPRMLLDAGADLNLCPWDNTALMSAVWKGRVSLVKLLLDRGADVDDGRPPPIVLAVVKERLDMFQVLREHDARLDTPETGGWAMAVANLNGLCSMVHLLEREGVGRDVILHRVARREEFDWYHRLVPMCLQGEYRNSG